MRNRGLIRSGASGSLPVAAPMLKLEGGEGEEEKGRQKKAALQAEATAASSSTFLLLRWAKAGGERKEFGRWGQKGGGALGLGMSFSLRAVGAAVGLESRACLGWAPASRQRIGCRKWRENLPRTTLTLGKGMVLAKVLFLQSFSFLVSTHF